MSARKTKLVVPKPDGYTETLEREGATDVVRGDRVRVKSTGEGRHDGFPAVFDHAFVDKGGLCACLREMAGTVGKGSNEFVQWRFVRPERIVRKRKQG